MQVETKNCRMVHSISKMSNTKANFIGKSPCLFPSQKPPFSKQRHLDTFEAVQVAPKNPAMQSIAMYELAPRT